MSLPRNIAHSEEYLALCQEKTSVLREENFQTQRKYAISATDEIIFRDYEVQTGNCVTSGGKLFLERNGETVFSYEMPLGRGELISKKAER